MSLKVIHTADWHLGQTFFEYDRDEEHDAFLEWLLQLLTDQQADVLLISGDVFDVSNPSSASQRKFYSFLRRLNLTNPHLQTVIIAGNHDSAARLEAPIPLLEVMNTSIIGMVRRDENRNIDYSSLIIPLFNRNGDREALCMAIPYLRPGDCPASSEDNDSYAAGIERMYKAVLEHALLQKNSQNEALIAMGHLYASGAELSDDDRAEGVVRGGLEAVAANAFDSRIAYTALGHIHKAQKVGGRENVRYAGSPLPMSFSEKNYRHQIVSLLIENGTLIDVDFHTIPVYAPLQCVPQEAASPDEVLDELMTLPLKKDGDNPARYPYINVRVSFDGPNPMFRSKVDEALRDKAVRLATITQISGSNKNTNEKDFIDYGEFKEVQPLDMLRKIYLKEYANDLPTDLEELFNQASRELNL